MSTGSVVGTSADLFPPRIEQITPVTSAPEALSASEGRNQAIDVVRLFAAAGIVFVHAGESSAFDRWGNVFRFGVPFFLFASLFYQSSSLRRHPDRTLLQFIAGRIKRLYIPFIVWSAVYLLVRDIKRVAILHISPVMPHTSMLWAGTEYHLWFLPFLLVCSIALGIAQRLVFRHDYRLRWPAIGIAIGIGLAIASAPMPTMPTVTESTFDDPTYAVLQWWLALPAASWGFAFAWFMTLGPVAFSVPQLMGLAGIVLVSWCSFRQALHGIELAPRGLSGLGCMVAALSPWRGPVVSAMARVGRLGYGIYLCHVIPVEILHLISNRCHLAPSSGLDIVTFVLAFGASLGIVSLLAKSPRLAWLNG